MDKNAIIKRIKSILSEWGDYRINELESSAFPMFEYRSDIYYTKIERLDKNKITVTQYINEIPLGSDHYAYEDISEYVLESIIPVIEHYDSLMWTERTRNVDYDV